ncbi:MAG: hypothetical protein H0W73_19500 [Bacteroidetes bacterium]|nr:hypothetical protein [Bacteroidota bacterium]
MKKTFSIILLTIFLFNLCGYLIFFKAAQFKVRKEIKALLKKKVPEKDLHIISFSLKNIKNIEWEKKDKEFRYNGTMYDVVKWRKDKDSIFYYCINDHQETQLFAHLDELINKQIDNEKSPNGRAAKNLLKKFSVFKYISAENFAFVTTHNSETGSFIYSIYCFPVVMEIPTPPPNSFI